MRGARRRVTLETPMLVVTLAVAAGVALLAAMMLYAPDSPEPDDDGR
jgi:hypothetical protein